MNISPAQTIKRNAIAQWLGLALGLIALGALLVFNLYREFAGAATREQDRLAAQARVISDNMEFQLASANRALESVARELRASGSPSRLQTVTLHLKSFASTMSGVASINVLDAKGRIVASNRPESIGTNLSRRDYFQMIKQRPNAGMLYVSPPFKTILGVFAINITKMISGPRGEFEGVVSATLDPDYFKTLMASVLYAPDMWVSVAHGDGQLFLMIPEREHVQGMNLQQPGSFFTRHQNSGKEAEVLTGTVYATKEVRMMALHTVHPVSLKMDKSLVVAVSRDLDTIFQFRRRDAVTQAALFGLIATVSILGLYIFQRGQLRFERQTIEAAAALQQSAERLQLATDASGIGVWDYDLAENRLVWDDSMYALYGIDRASVSSSYDVWYNSVLPEDRPALDAALHATLYERAPYMPSFRIRRGDSGLRYIQARARIYYDAAGKPVRLVGTNEDITERKALQDKLEVQANQDYLTGLFNRRHFLEQGQVEFARMLRYGESLSVFMLDVDRFKGINDTYGHKTGDIVLQKLSEVLRQTLRTFDIIGRFGGEEFAVLLPETDAQKAHEVAERLREITARTDVALEGGLLLRFTVSIGVATLKDKTTTLDMLLNQADKALYRAKEGGRNKVCVAD